MRASIYSYDASAKGRQAVLAGREASGSFPNYFSGPLRSAMYCRGNAGANLYRRISCAASRQSSFRTVFQRYDSIDAASHHVLQQINHMMRCSGDAARTAGRQIELDSCAIQSVEFSARGSVYLHNALKTPRSCSGSRRAATDRGLD